MASSLDQTIAEWWKATESLEQLIPSDRVSTEVRQADEEDVDDEDEDFVFDDFVTLDISTETQWRTNSGQGFQSEVLVMIVSASYDHAKDVASKLRSWERQKFTGAENKITMCLVGPEEAEQQDEDGTWEVSLNLVMNHTSA